jgi:hypothetical protein
MSMSACETSLPDGTRWQGAAHGGCLLKLSKRMRPAASRRLAPDCHVECLAMKLVGELDAGNRHVQFDERGRETECWPSTPSHRACPRLYLLGPRAMSRLRTTLRRLANIKRHDPHAALVRTIVVSAPHLSRSLSARRRRRRHDSARAAQSCRPTSLGPRARPRFAQRRSDPWNSAASDGLGRSGGCREQKDAHEPPHAIIL